MAGNGKKRVEPRFGSGTRGTELRVTAEDRTAGPPAGKTRAKSAAKPASAAKSKSKTPAKATASSGRAAKPKPTKSNTRRTGKGSRKGGRGAQRQSAKASRRSRRRARPFIVRLIRGGVYWGSVAAVWGFIAVIGIIAFYGMQLPNTSEWAVPDRPPNIQIVSVDGALIANRGDTGGEAVRLEHLPDHVPNAVIAIEDHRFRRHFGLDPIGFSRAMLVNVRARALVQGGSTLTQQLAKNMFLTPERSFRRKVQELVLALWLETEFSKDQILEMYLNRVYFGAGAYGIDAAARRYYNKSASQLSAQEAAVIAGLLRAPSYYAPNRHPERAYSRSVLVLNAMAREGFLTPEEAQAARTATAKVASRHVGRSESYVADFVMERLLSYVSKLETDIIVETTIDIGLQRDAEWALVEALKRDGEKYGVSQGAVIALDGTGAVRAMVGGRDYAKSQFNRATQARRQPGSAFKPFVYLTALEMGLTPETVRVDGPVKIGNWSPKNYNKKYSGPVTLRKALSHSLNTVAAKLAAEVGPANVVKTAHRMGVNSTLAANASIALGTSEVTLMELTAAYTPLANGGHTILPYVIRSIRTADGAVIFERDPHSLGRAIDGRTLVMMNDMMRETLLTGTGKKAQIPGWPAGGKTGTSQDFRDAWFVGYTANLIAGVWLGNDDNSPTKRASGGNLPTTIWSRFMQTAHQGLTPVALPGGDYVAQARQPRRTMPANADVPRKRRGPGAFFSRLFGRGG